MMTSSNRKSGFILLAIGTILLATIAAGAGFERWSRHQAWATHPAPGRLVDVGGRRMQIDCRGAGSPTVVLIHGLDTGGATTFSKVHSPIARFTRTCAISRAGIMWSDPDDRPFDAARQVEDMQRSLAAAGERGPFVLVPHSLGGPYSLMFTHRYPNKVAGLVFVDASHPDMATRASAITGPQPKRPQQFVDWIMMSLGWSGLPRLLMDDGASGPPWLPKSDAAAEMAFAPTTISTLMREEEAIPATLAAARSTVSNRRHPLGDRPFIVLTAADTMNEAKAASAGVSPRSARRLGMLWSELGEEAAAWSSCGLHKIVPRSEHYIQYMQPNAVITSVRSVVMQIRNAKNGGLCKSITRDTMI